MLKTCVELGLEAALTVNAVLAFALVIDAKTFTRPDVHARLKTHALLGTALFLAACVVVQIDF